MRDELYLCTNMIEYAPLQLPRRQLAELLRRGEKMTWRSNENGELH